MTAGSTDAPDVNGRSEPASSAHPDSPGSVVSRETGARPALSASALALLGDSLSTLDDYVALLAGPGVERGLIGPREAPRLWDRHILNCAVVAPLIPHGATVDDVGSGAGLPGMVLALVRPDLEVTLVEPLLRRATFLREVVADLKAANVRVERIRAEDAARGVGAGARSQRDVVTARAVAPLDRLASWCLPLLGDGGQLLALKGARAAEEARSNDAAVRALGARSIEVLEVGQDIVEPPTTVIRIIAGAKVPQSRSGRSR